VQAKKTKSAREPETRKYYAKFLQSWTSPAPLDFMSECKAVQSLNGSGTAPSEAPEGSGVNKEGWFELKGEVKVQAKGADKPAKVV